MKLKTKYILPILLILTLIVSICSVSQLLQSGADDSTPPDAVLENEDDPLVNMSRDTKEYLAALCADNNIELNVKKDTYIGWYYDVWNILNISFCAKDLYVHDRLLIMRNVAYYIQDWINDNYSVEETPLYRIECEENYFSSYLPSDGYICFSNFNCFNNYCDIKDAKPARSIEYVDLQVRYDESSYRDLSFEGITHLCTGTRVERLTKDFSVLKHFPDLENVVIPILTSKTDEEINEFIDDVKQYCPSDCDIIAYKM